MFYVNRLPFVDALRGMAVFAVIVAHTGQHIPNLPYIVKSLLDQGARGVQLFFIISAFTLFLSMSVKKNKERHTTLNFFIRRFFRIAPLFYCAIVFYLIRDGFGPRYWLGDAPGITLSNIIATITFTNGWNPYWFNSVVPGGWSVAVEMSFYLFVPYLFSIIKSLKAALTATFSSFIFSGIVNFFLLKHPLITAHQLWNDYLFIWFVTELPVFCLGFVLFFLINHFKPKISQYKIGSLLILISLIIMITLAFYNPVSKIPITFTYSLCFVLLAFGLALNPAKIFVNKFWCYLGTISYSAYLTHFAILPITDWFVKELPIKSSLLFLICLGVMLVGTAFLSTLTYRFIELPGQLLGKQLIIRIEKVS